MCFCVRLTKVGQPSDYFKTDATTALLRMSSLLYNTVTFPFTEHLAQRIMTYMDVGRAMDFLAKSADKIIQGRRLESDQSALVSSQLSDYMQAKYYLQGSLVRNLGVAPLNKCSC